MISLIQKDNVIESIKSYKPLQLDYNIKLTVPWWGLKRWANVSEIERVVEGIGTLVVGSCGNCTSKTQTFALL